MGLGRTWGDSPTIATFTRPRLNQIGFSIADQALSAGGMFLVNLALARFQTKEEYGLFALSYSVFAFLTGLHNAVILEPFTVYGSGRYRSRFSEYFKLMAQSNAVLGVLLTGFLLVLCLLFRWVAPLLVSRALVGLALTVGVLLSGSFLRRVFYLQRKPALAAKTSLLFFLTVALGLWLTARSHALNGLSVFLVLGAGWITAGLGVGRSLPFGDTRQTFLEAEPEYWSEHWKYMRWVLLTAVVFQLTTQGYYWLVAGFLSINEVADLKAMAILIAPMDQIFIALNYVVLPIMASHYSSRDMKGLLPIWKKYVTGMIAATLSFSLFIRIFGKSLAHILYAGRFDNAASLLAGLALLPFVLGVGHTINAALKAAEMPKLVLYAYLCSGAATLLLGIPMVASWGLWGAVYGLLVSGAAYTGALAVCFIRNILPKASGKPVLVS